MAGVTVIGAVVSVVFQIYELPPLAVKMVLSPLTIDRIPAIVAVGCGIIVMVLLLVSVQPLMSVTVTI